MNDRPYNDPALSEALKRNSKEWLPTDFEERVISKTRRRGRWQRVAAAFIGTLMLSGIAWAAYHGVHHTAEPQRQETLAVSRQHAPEVQHETVCFDNATLDSILATVAQHYQKQVEYRNQNMRSLHFHIKWNRTAPLADFITLINNFEGINVSQQQDTIVVE